MNDKLKNLYTDEYFENRDLHDKKRLRAFALEKEFIKKYIWEGRLCDVGCSTGEFLHYIKWEGERYGMEINENARRRAKERNINFERNIANSDNFFDIVFFRGTIQHLPSPFLYIENAYKSLRKGGYIAFLATPNANSIYYKLFKTLPMLDPKRNYYIPSDVTLSDVLRNAGFEIVEIAYPYLDSPYCRVIQDHYKFFKKLLFKTNDTFAFWRSSMNLLARKR